MKSAEEIYCIKFDKSYSEKGELQYGMYELGKYPFGSSVIPISIVLESNNRITVIFDNGVKHILYYAEDVELFMRPKVKEKTEENGGTTDTGTKPAKAGRGKNTS
jgi:hypothetical protein